MSRKHLTDAELASSWPYLTRAQVQEFKEAPDIFDVDGGGTITVEELEEVIVVGAKTDQGAVRGDGARDRRGRGRGDRFR